MSHLAASLRIGGSIAAVAGALVLLALAAPALAQTPGGSLTMSVEPTSLDLEAANTTTLSGTIRYDDQLPVGNGGVTLTVTAPEGWTATVDPSTSFILQPGDEQEFTLTLVAPAAGEGAATGNVEVAATADSGAGRAAATAAAAISVTRIDPAPPVIVPWYQTPLGMGGIALALLLVVGAVVGTRRRNARLAADAAAREAAERAAWLERETGITLALGGGPLQYGHKREVVYRILVTNASQRPRVAILDIAQATNGWRASFQVTKLPLSVGETQAVTLVVTPDAVITPGDVAQVTVRVKPEEAREKDERITLEVAAPKHGSPTDPHYRIVTVHREGANGNTLKR